jgi:DNA-binding MarR family transcriptional regulator
VLEETLPRAQARERQRRSLRVGQPSRLRRQLARTDCGVLRSDPVPIERGHAEHLVADAETVNALRHGHNHARELVRRRRREAVDRPLELVTRYRGCMNTDERLAGTRRRHVHLLECQTAEPARRQETKGTHLIYLTRKILGRKYPRVVREHDHVDALVEQWRRERPDLDVTALALVGRLFRVARLLDPPLAATLAENGLQPGWFDILAALRRAGEPYELSPTELVRETLLTSGGMTKRLDRLADAGLVRRRPDPADRRGVLIALTRRGNAVVDRALEAHLENEERLLAGLTDRERQALNGLLRRLLVGLES